MTDGSGPTTGSKKHHCGRPSGQFNFHKKGIGLSFFRITVANGVGPRGSERMVFMKKVGVIMGSDSDLPVVEKPWINSRSTGCPTRCMSTPPPHAGAGRYLCPDCPGKGVRRDHRCRRQGSPPGRCAGRQHRAAGDWHPGEVLHPGWAGCTALHRSNAHGHSGSHCGHRWGCQCRPPGHPDSGQSPMQTWRTSSARPEPQSPKRCWRRMPK